MCNPIIAVHNTNFRFVKMVFLTLSSYVHGCHIDLTPDIPVNLVHMPRKVFEILFV